MASPTLKFKRGLQSALPSLAIGEPGFTTDTYRLYVGGPNGNKLIGGDEFFNVESTTVGGGIKLFEATNNGTDFVELQSPASLTGIQTFIVPGTDGTADQVLKTDGSGNLSFADLEVSVINIDGATDIGADIVDDDLFIVDDGGGGTNRKTAASRIKSYVLGGASGGTFSDIVVGSAVTINSNGIDAGTSGIITAGGGFVGDLTGNASSADQVLITPELSSSTSHFVAFAEQSVSPTDLHRDTGLQYVPDTNTLTATNIAVTGFNLGGTDVTSTAAELNVLDGIPATLTATELGFVDGVTSSIQTQLDAKGTLSNQNDLITLSGVAAASTTLGTFTGNTISDDETIKGALQDLETQLDSMAGGGAQAVSVSVGATDTNATFFLTFVSDNNTTPTQELFKTDAGVSYNPSTNILTAESGNFTSVTVGSAVTINGGGIHAPSGIISASSFVGDVTGNSTSSDTVDVTDASSTDTAFNLLFADGAGSGQTVNIDTGLTYNASSNQLTVGVVAATTADITSATIDNLTFTSGTAITSVDTDITSVSGSDDTLPSAKAVKTYVDSSIAGIAVTFGIDGDTGSGIVTTGTTLTIQGTANEVETSVVDHVLTIGLPNTVNITTELDVPTIETGAIQAKDGTAAITLADSTGKVTTSTDHEVQGTFTAANNSIFQGNTDIGDAVSDTVTIVARVDSDFTPSTDSERDLGSSSLAWREGYIDHINGTHLNITGVATASEFKGTSLTMTGGGTFGGNVEISGNLSVGGSVTNIDVEDLRIVSPVIELGLERLGDGSLQPPSNVTTYNSGVVMYYNTVGVSSDNAKLAAMFAKVKPGGDFRIGFATDVVITTVGAGDSVASVAAWADIEAKGLWINDCSGVSQVISCSDSTRFLENITVDGGSF